MDLKMPCNTTLDPLKAKTCLSSGLSLQSHDFLLEWKLRTANEESLELLFGSYYELDLGLGKKKQKHKKQPTKNSVQRSFMFCLHHHNF